MRASLFVVVATLGLSAAALNACNCGNNCATPGGGGAAPNCRGGCGCYSSCTCNAAGQTVCPAVACIASCLDDAGTTQYPGSTYERNGEVCTCDYSGNIHCCPEDGGSCATACVDNGTFRTVGETWPAPDGGVCNCNTGFVVDCGKPPVTAHCSFAGQAYTQGQSVDAGAGCGCACGDQGHVTCPASACLPNTCSYQGSSYSTGLIFQSGECNFCLCGDDGAMACTGRQCAANKCEYAGTVYDAGTSFPSADGCNTCTCQSSGSTSCTSLGCAAVHCLVDGGAVAVGTTFLTQDKCNVCGCSSDGKVYCTSRPCTP